LTHLIFAYEGTIHPYCEGNLELALQQHHQLFPAVWYYEWDETANEPRPLRSFPDLCPECDREWRESFT
jgi:hypothetical protein